MNTTDLIERVAAEHGVAKEHARKILESAFTAIVSAVENDEDVALSGFGRFKLPLQAIESRRTPGPQSGERRNDRNPRLQDARLHRRQGSTQRPQ